MNLNELAKITHGKLIGKDTNFFSFSTDTRSIKPGELFIALKGENFDGHDFVQTAMKKGAAAALVSQAVKCDLPQIIVTDTLIALSQWAKQHRQQFNIPVIGVTGSCGKTTTKALLTSILSEAGKVLANEGTLNNHFGVPLTLLRLTAEHDFAVIEMGANHVGEIAHLVSIAEPTHAVITCIAPVHLEGFGSLDSIAAAKAEIYSQLPAAGAAVINADDHYANFLRNKIHNTKCISFGTASRADIRASNVQLNEQNHVEFLLATADAQEKIILPLVGKHNITNALAAAAVAHALQIPLTVIKTGLEKSKPVNKRLNVYHPATDIVVIDDSYNASPIATKAALEILSQAAGEKIFVFGDMLELGPEAEKYHYEIGQEAARLGIDQLYTFGKLTKATMAGFGKQAQHFTQHSDLIAQLRQHIKAPSTILVKGSNSMQMGKVVEALREKI